jgi:hypothetical protein
MDPIPEAPGTGTPASAAEEPEWAHVASLYVDMRVRERRALALVVLAVAALLALSTRLHTLEGAGPNILGWLAWGALLMAALAGAGPLTPGRADALWETLTGLEGRFREADDDAARAARVSAQLGIRIARLRRSLRLAVALTVVALGLAAVAYALAG